VPIDSPGLQPGTTQHLAALAGDGPPESIPEVLDRLVAIGDHAAGTSMLGENDGIAAFTRLYHVITDTIGGLAAAGEFADSEFLVRLDLEFAERYFAALRRYAVDACSVPRPWRVLFDNRSNPCVPAVNFAVAGVNAHINYDLAAALVSTWDHVSPDAGGPGSAQYRDYCAINDVFETNMDPLREDLGSLLSQGPDGAVWDRAANHLADLVIRFTRDLAWDEAREVWTDGADDRRRRASDRKLDAIAGFLGGRLLSLPLPV
jgi:hypothetical protein